MYAGWVVLLGTGDSYSFDNHTCTFTLHEVWKGELKEKRRMKIGFTYQAGVLEVTLE